MVHAILVHNESEYVRERLHTNERQNYGLKEVGVNCRVDVVLVGRLAR